MALINPTPHLEIERGHSTLGRKPKRRTRYIRLGGIHIWRFGRAARFSKEWHNYKGTRYLQFGISDPHTHRLWSFSCTIYLPFNRR